MKAITLSLLMVGAAVLVAAPPAAATNYEVCDPEGTVCFVQDDGSGEDQGCEEDGHLAHYGRNRAEDAVYVDPPTSDDDRLVVTARESCGHWHLHNAHRYGFLAKGQVQDVGIDARWQSYDIDPNHDCEWGNDYRDGDRLWIIVTVDGEPVGVAWWEQTTEDCETGQTSYECHTEVLAEPVASEDAGCPTGGPPGPPSSDAFPYGQVLP